jgi:tyrosyl-tRNA synthetase
MSKSLGNHVGVAEPAEEIFGKVMSVSDELMYRYWELLCGRDPAGLRRDVDAGKAHPMELKKDLAETLAARFQGEAEAAAARAAFEQRFQKRQIDLDAIPETRRAAGDLPDRLSALLHAVELVSSNSDGRRMIAQGAVRIDGEVVRDEGVSFGADKTYLIQVGKRRALRLSVV